MRRLGQAPPLSEHIDLKEPLDGDLGVTDGVLVECVGMLDPCQVHALDTRSGRSHFVNDIRHRQLVEAQDGA